MRWLILLALAAGCASAGAPPGGPEDKAAPTIVAIKPDSGATLVAAKSVDFRFDEVVSDRPAGGKTELNQLFLISPWDGPPRVKWHRSHIEVRPQKGFRPNTAYSVTLLPGLSDLRGNVMSEEHSIIFSTGTEFPRLGILGYVFDWAQETAARDAFVEAITPDSVRYVAVTDSTGRFNIGPLPAGTFLVRALIDANNNRVVDRNEKWDTTRVVLSTTRPQIELRAIERDSEPAVIFDITAPDTVTLQVTFDKWIDPAQLLDASVVRVQRSDSTELQVVSVRSKAQLDKARADSTRRADSLRVASQRAPSAIARPAPPPAPRPSLPPPGKAIVIQLASTSPLKAGQTYRVTARGVRNLVGHTREVTRTFSMPGGASPPP